MTDQTTKKCNVVRLVIATVALLFGALTIKSGGDVLFWSEEARIAAGNYVPFVLWFNFVSGFFYMIVGIALYMRQPWAVYASAAILLGIMTVFLALGLSIYIADIAYETRTIAAMTLRTVVWAVITLLSYKVFQHQRSDI